MRALLARVLVAALLAGCGERMRDWAHPNAKGYARIAQSLADVLKRAKAI